jgi:hypothetical protein
MLMLYFWLRVSDPSQESQAQFSVTKNGTLRDRYNIGKLFPNVLEKSSDVGYAWREETEKEDRFGDSQQWSLNGGARKSYRPEKHF